MNELKQWSIYYYVCDTMEIFKKLSIHFGIEGKSLHVSHHYIEEDVAQMCSISISSIDIACACLHSLRVTEY